MGLAKETSKIQISNTKLLQKSPKLIPLVISLTLIFLTLVFFFHPSQWQSLLLLKVSTSQTRTDRLGTMTEELEEYAPSEDHTTTTDQCDMFTGQWVPNPNAPYYTNTTCSAIQQHQNCMKYGRPDSEFMKWRWKPDGCELPLFDPGQFLELVRGKSMAFVGDSVARNHMQSLICLLSRVQYPIDYSRTRDENFKIWKYPEYNFTISTLWTPYLVRAEEVDKAGPNHTYRCNLYLDEFDDTWTTQIDEFDYVILSGGHWFFRPLVFYENREIVGCQYCKMENVTHLTKFYGARKAFGTALRAINSRKNYRGITFLRTFAPSHFEGGIWNEGGDCARTRPYMRNETTLSDQNQELYLIQIEEFRKAGVEGRKRGKKFRLLDTTQAMLLRPDGHPRSYGRWPHENVPPYNDCVHWCLPGPIDSWNDLLLQMLKMEGRR